MTSAIVDYLRRFRGEEVLFLPNPGNAGDSMISTGSYHALEEAGVRYRTPRIGNFDATGRIVIYGGGGNLYERGRHSYNTLKRIHAQAKHVTILPHTIKDVDDLLAAFGPNVTVISRELVTDGYVRGFGGRYEALLMDDMAFSIDMERLMSGRDGFSTPAMLLHFLRSRLLGKEGHTSFDNVKRYLNPGPVAARLQARQRGGVLNCFRLDGEATDIEVPADNVDLPIVFMFGGVPAPVAYHAARSMMQVLSTFDEVRTNRLHVSIACGLLGLRTQFFPNNYYKCRAVWEYSMAHRFPNIAWMG
jgi:exopolysaccharide biosynthesis predicted pyruvyltransferase EpsI